MMVDSMPTLEAPPSSTTFALRASCGKVGLSLPEGLALGAAMGVLTALRNLKAMGWDGILKATVVSPATAFEAMLAFGNNGNTIVRGEGKK